MRSTELARIFMAGADQLLQDLSAGKTREKVWSVRGKLNESITHAYAYITEDYARAIQEERKVAA